MRPRRADAEHSPQQPGKRLIDGQPLQAELFAPDQTGPHPAIVVIGGAEEGIPARRLARRFRREGYAALALAPEQITLEGFATVTECLRSVAGVDCARIALLGLGPGAHNALLIASHYPEVRAVVAVAPGAAAMLPVERIAGPILLVAGTDDARWPAMDNADQIIERLAEHRFSYGVSLHSYGGAGHWLFGPPIDPSDPLALRLAQLGGTVRGNVAARLDAWRKTLSFLNNSLGPATAASSGPVIIHDDCWIGG